MSVQLNFEAIPLEYDGFPRLASEQSGFELEEEYSRRGRVRSPGRGFAPRASRIMSKQPTTPPVPQPAKTKRPPYPPPRTPPYPRWRGVIAPYGVAPEPYPVVREPYPAEPAPTGSEYMRWVQSALSDVLGLKLPLHGIADAGTRSAIRSFQRREQLPADAVVGPDTERALIAARGGRVSPTGAFSEPDVTQSVESAPTPEGAEGELSRLARPCGCPSCRRGEPCRCKSQRESYMTNMRDIQPEAFEFQPETLAEEIGFESEIFEDEFDGLHALSAEGPMAWEAPMGGAANRQKPQMTCPKYDKGEVQKSRTAQGHLPSAVISHPRGVLIADFGVDWRTPRESLKREKALQDWLPTTAQVIQANPTTKIRILGFSDCVGNERNNSLLRQGRAVRMAALLQQMSASSPQWKLIKSKIGFVGAAPAGDYVSDNDTVQGRAKNRSVLLESSRKVTMEPTVVTARPRCLPPVKGLASTLSVLIPDDQDYRKYLPLNYRLNAKKTVGEVAQDLSSKGKWAHFGLEAAHWAIVLAEIFELAGVLAIAAPVLGGVLVFMSLGAPYQELAEEIAAEWSARGFSRGVVMGADGRPARMVKEYFGNEYFPKNPFFDRGPVIAKANYLVGLLTGYLLGRVLCPNQRTIFWRDLGQRMGDQSYRGPTARWAERDWRDWYRDSATAFTGYHL